MRRVVFILFLLATSCVSFCQTKAVTKIAERISAKGAKEAAFKTASKRTAEELLREGIERTGKKYTGEALGEQIAKRVLRENVMKRMEKEGMESFLDYGKSQALKEFERMGTSNVKRNIILKEAATATRPSAYHMAIGEIGGYISKTMTRILVSSKNQFVSKSTYLKWVAINDDRIVRTGVKDASVLRKNMLAVMGNDAKYAMNTLKNGNQAHHIIGNKTPMAAEKLHKYGIDINDPMNGVFLPSSSRSGLRGTIHRGGHTQDYYDYIEQMFSSCRSKEDCYDVLDKIKNDLYKGKIKLYSDGVNKVNKTFTTVG